MRRLIGLLMGLWMPSVWAGVVAQDAATGNILEYQERGDIATVQENMRRAGYAPEQVTVREMPPAEWEALVETQNRQPARERLAKRHAAKQAALVKLKAATGLSDKELRALFEETPE